MKAAFPTETASDAISIEGQLGADQDSIGAGIMINVGGKGGKPGNVTGVNNPSDE
jgi:hypothetical protein